MNIHHLALMRDGTRACIVCGKTFEDEAMAATVACVPTNHTKGFWTTPRHGWLKASGEVNKTVMDDLMRKIQLDFERRLIDPTLAKGTDLLRGAGYGLTDEEDR